MIDPETINDLETACEVIRQLVRRLEALERAVGELRGKLEEARREGAIFEGHAERSLTRLLGFLNSADR